MSLIYHLVRNITRSERQAGEKQCFVSHEFRDHDMRKTLETALKPFELQPYFADQEVTGTLVLDKVYRKVVCARACIFDLTSTAHEIFDPRVYFELGLAIGLNKPVLVILKQRRPVPELLENFVNLHFTYYAELEQQLSTLAGNWLKQTVEQALFHQQRCHFVRVDCEHRQRISPQQRYFVIDQLMDRGMNRELLLSYDQDLQARLPIALKSYHLAPEFLDTIMFQSGWPLCAYCQTIRDSSFALCHLAQATSANVYLLLGLVFGLGVPVLPIIQLDHKGQLLFEIPSILQGLDMFEYTNYEELGDKLPTKIRGFLENARKTRPLVDIFGGATLPAPAVAAYNKEVLHEQLSAAAAIPDQKERAGVLIEMTRNLALRNDSDGLQEVLLSAQSIMDPAAQTPVLILTMDSMADIRDVPGMKRVLTTATITTTLNLSQLTQISQAAYRAFERIGERESFLNLLRECSSCGSSVKPQQIFCPQCGARLLTHLARQINPGTPAKPQLDSQTISKCPLCGNDNLLPDEEYCDQCGTPLYKDHALSMSQHLTSIALTLPSATPALGSSQGLDPITASLPAKIQHGLDTYEVIARIEREDFYATYRVRHEASGLWALRVFRPPPDIAANVNETLRRLFLQEAELLRSLKHPYLPIVADVFEYQGHAITVMELIDGQTLADQIREITEPLPMKQVIAYGIQLTAALGYLHDQQPPILHDYLTATDIMRTPKGLIKLRDLGMVRSHKPRKSKLLVMQHDYRSPEHYEHQPIDARSNIYFVGAVLFHLLTHKPPLLLQRTLPGSITGLNPSIDTRLEQIVIRAMEYNPEDRYQSMLEFRMALLDCLSKVLGI